MIRPGRRQVIGLLAGLPLGLPGAFGGVAAAQGAENFRGGATVLVAGPDDGPLDVLSRRIVPALSRALPAGTTLSRTLAGGPDGVTGAHQSDTRFEPDGRTLLMVPGAAGLAWLSGDPRAQFDAGKWVAVIAATTPCVVAGRISTNRSVRGRVRVAASSATGPEMAALLALELLGIPFTPVFRLGEAAAARQAYAQGSVDLVLAHGPHALEELDALASVHAAPLFSFGTPGDPGRDPLVPDVPDMAEYARSALHGPLFDAWQGAAAASRLDYALVLPQLTPPAMVAAWRRAGAQSVATPDIHEVSDSLRTVAAPAATPAVAAIAANAAALLELRRWLAIRFNWRP